MLCLLTCFKKRLKLTPNNVSKLHESKRIGSGRRSLPKTRASNVRNSIRGLNQNVLGLLWPVKTVIYWILIRKLQWGKESKSEFVNFYNLLLRNMIGVWLKRKEWGCPWVPFWSCVDASIWFHICLMLKAYRTSFLKFIRRWQLLKINGWRKKRCFLKYARKMLTQLRPILKQMMKSQSSFSMSSSFYLLWLQLKRTILIHCQRSILKTFSSNSFASERLKMMTK